MVDFVKFTSGLGSDNAFLRYSETTPARTQNLSPTTQGPKTDNGRAEPEQSSFLRLRIYTASVKLAQFDRSSNDEAWLSL